MRYASATAGPWANWPPKPDTRSSPGGELIGRARVVVPEPGRAQLLSTRRLPWRRTLGVAGFAVADSTDRRLAGSARPTATVPLAVDSNRNLYRSEVLFLRGINPWRPVGKVDDLDRVVSLAQRLLDANKDRIGQVTTGVRGVARRRG